jgi:hypothetical protein
MFHLNLSSSETSWVSREGVRVVAPGPLGIGEITLATCANQELADVFVNAFSAAPVNLRHAVFMRPESAAVKLLEGVDAGRVPEDLRTRLREWRGLDHTRTDAAFVALCAFVQSALDAADRADATRV